MSAEPGGDNVEIESLNKHLWNLLMKGTQNVNEDVVHEELARNRDKILNCLTSYEKKDPTKQRTVDSSLGLAQKSSSSGSSGRFGRFGGGDGGGSYNQNGDIEKTRSVRHSLGLFDKKSLPMSLSSSYLTPIGTSLFQEDRNKIESTTRNQSTFLDPDSKNFEKKLINEISEKLNLTEECSKRIFSAFMVMEYKGGKTSYEKIYSNSVILSNFIKDLTAFYYRERLCLIYCSQVILSSTLDETHPYMDIFCKFVCSISMDTLCENLCKSLDVAETDQEIVEIINTLALVIGHYSVNFGHTLKMFERNFRVQPNASKSEELMIAEACLFSVILMSGNSGDEDNTSIVNILEVNSNEINNNPYVFPTYVSAVADKCKHNEIIRNKLKLQGSMGDNSKQTVPVMIKLVEYCTSPIYVRSNVLKSLILRSIFITMENILKYFARETFGSNPEWFLLFAKILKTPEISSLFLEEGYEFLNQLYNDALILFPIEIESILAMWGSICYNNYEGSTISTLINNLSRVTFVAEPMDQVDTSKIRSRMETTADINENQEYFLIEDRKVYGITLVEKTRGIFVPQDELIVWHLHFPSDKSFWAILLTEVLQPSLIKLQKSSKSDSYIDPSIESQVNSIANFLIDYSKNSDFATFDLTNLFYPVVSLLKIFVLMKTDAKDKGKSLSKLLEVIETGWKFEPNILKEEFFWPSYSNANLIGEFILSHESSAKFDYSVTKCYLKLVQSVFNEIIDNDDSIMKETMKEFCSPALFFVIENILPAYVSWRIPSNFEKYEMLKETCELLSILFKNNNNEWKRHRDFAKSSLLGLKSPIIGLFEISEDELQDGCISPNSDNYLLPEVFNTCMSLLLETVSYDQEKSGKDFGKLLGLELVFKLGRLARHRLNSNIPILSMKMLKNISEEMPKCFLGCLGKETESFRELIIQRLEYKSEDIQLKIAILEFLTVSCQTQPGLTNQFFNETVLADFLLDLISEKDEELSVAILGFVRALLGLGNTLLKKCKTNNMWKKIFLPACKMEIGGDIKIIEYTFHLISFELFSFGISNPEFFAVLNDFFKEDFKRLLLISISESNEESKRKSLLALKHMLTLVISKTGSGIFNDEMKHETFEIFEEKFWEEKQIEESSGSIKAPIAELLLMLMPHDNQQFLTRLTFNLANSFDTDFVAVQLPLLALIKKCIETAKYEIDTGTLDCIVRIVSNIFTRTARIFENEDPKYFTPIFTSSTAIISMIITSKYCNKWEGIFHKHFILYGILAVANIGITRELGPEIVLQCLSVLIEVSKVPNCSEMLCLASLSNNIWLPASKYISPALNNHSLWSHVYLLCLQLNSSLVKSHRYFYMEDCLNYWGIHGHYIAEKLWSITQVVDLCYKNNPEKNFTDMTQLLTFIHIVLYSVSLMVPFLKPWGLQQPDSLNKIMEGTFVALRTTIELLSQPKHLQVLLVKNKTMSIDHEFKGTPQIMEIQTKLWNVTGMAIHILWTLRSGQHNFIDNGQLLSTLYSVCAMCVKSLTKGGEKKLNPTINSTSKITLTLEKTLDLLFYRGNIALNNDLKPPKEQLAMKREIATEIAVLCESIKRLTIPTKTLFMEKMCEALEESFK